LKVIKKKVAIFILLILIIGRAFRGNYGKEGSNLRQGRLGMTPALPVMKGKFIAMVLRSWGGKAAMPVFSIAKWSKSLENQFRVGVQFLS
jgi:hypothetical protein